MLQLFLMAEGPGQNHGDLNLSGGVNWEYDM